MTLTLYLPSISLGWQQNLAISTQQRKIDPEAMKGTSR
jgi:hypothetical protein